MPAIPPAQIAEVVRAIHTIEGELRRIRDAIDYSTTPPLAGVLELDDYDRRQIDTMMGEGCPNDGSV